MATAEQITIANKTSRHSPAVGAKALTPKMARQFVEGKYPNKDCLMLDYGAGKKAMHAQAFVEDGWNCLAHEFGDNVDPRIHCELAMLNKYDVVYASNVLNVQSDLNMLNETVEQIKSVMKDQGAFIANYPLDPRKGDMTVLEVFANLSKHFKFVTWVDGKKNAPVWLMEN